MKDVEIGSNKFTKVQVDGHQYFFSPTDEAENLPAGRFGHILFQDGPIGESGINGCHQEDLLVVVIHRLQGFQAGEFSCRENALALTKLEEALYWLNHRTKSRQQRGVEGTSQK